MNLYIYIEVLEREFLSRLLIAMESASRGIKVHMGRLEPYIKRDFFVPGIILHKSITPSPKRINDLREYKKKNFIFTSLDEEVGLVNLDAKNYIKLRYSNKTLNLADKIFTWGKFDYDNLVRNFREHKSKFVLSGNPRVDFWRKDFEFFFKKKNFMYKDYILFSFNFILPTKKELKERLKYLKQTKYSQRGLTLSNYKRRIKDCFKLFEEYCKLIKVLSKKINSTIIVRPHPTDKIENYNFLNNYKNVKVIKKGSISNWIHHAKVVIHTGCSGGLEASIRGRPTISFIPFKTSFSHPYCDKFSIKTKNIKQCLDVINKIDNNSLKIKEPKLNNFKSRACNFVSKKPGYKIIVNEFIKLIKNNSYIVNKNNNDKLLKFKFKVREFRTKILNYKYGNIKFSTFDKKETLIIFEILKKLSPKYNDLSIDFIKKDIIYIKKN